jgi:hypothetical protein
MASRVSITVECGNCGAEQAPLWTTHQQLKAWVNGAHIQAVMPDLSPAERELLISGTCAACFEQMFGGEE